MRDVNTGQPLGEYQPWWYGKGECLDLLTHKQPFTFSSGEPNGLTLETCTEVWTSRAMWNDIRCHDLACGLCIVDKAPNIVMRGMKSFSSLQFFDYRKNARLIFRFMRKLPLWQQIQLGVGQWQQRHGSHRRATFLQRIRTINLVLRGNCQEMETWGMHYAYLQTISRY